MSNRLQQPSVSVVIPAYNQSHYLPGAVESVLAQTFRDFEIIVVDDGSSDDTRLVAQSFGGDVRYVWQENQGLAGARNTGIRHSQGEFVAFLDSDDEWLPKYLEEMIHLAEDHPEGDVYYCPVLYMDEDGQLLPQRSQAYHLPATDLYWKLLRANFLVPSTIFSRCSSLVAAGYFDPDFRRLQDWELWLRMLRAGAQFIELPQHLVRYRLHGSSLSTDPRGGQEAALAMGIKLFGPEDEPLENWTEEKRRVLGGVYRYHALSSVQYQADWSAAARFLGKAFRYDPSLASDLDLFYELALGSQPIGLRGTGSGARLEDNAHSMITAVESTFRDVRSSPSGHLRKKSLAYAHYGAGLLAYNSGVISLCRRYLWQAARLKPALFRDRRFVKTFLGSWVGRGTMAKLRQVRSPG